MIEFELVANSFPNNGQDVSGLAETAGFALGFGEVSSEINNTARSARGFPYFWPVDRGRRGFGPINAQALKITLPGGQVIFRKYVGPSQPRYITARMLTSLTGNMQAAAQSAEGGNFHAWLVSFLNGIADAEAQALYSLTPSVSGKLASSYRVGRAQ
jgi:hypothetical protein